MEGDETGAEAAASRADLSRDSIDRGSPMQPELGRSMMDRDLMIMSLAGEETLGQYRIESAEG